MGSMNCKLYDENLVHNIIISAGLSVMEFLSERRDADAEEVCEYLETHADSIIEETIDQMNSSEEYPEKDDNENLWPPTTNEQ